METGRSRVTAAAAPGHLELLRRPGAALPGEPPPPRRFPFHFFPSPPSLHVFFRLSLSSFAFWSICLLRFEALSVAVCAAGSSARVVSASVSLPTRPPKSQPSPWAPPPPPPGGPAARPRGPPPGGRHPTARPSPESPGAPALAHKPPPRPLPRRVGGGAGGTLLRRGACRPGASGPGPAKMPRGAGAPQDTPFLSFTWSLGGGGWGGLGLGKGQPSCLQREGRWASAYIARGLRPRALSAPRGHATRFSWLIRIKSSCSGL